MRKVGSLSRLAVGGAVLTALTAVTLVASSLAGAAKVAPVVISGNPNCADVPNASPSWKELKDVPPTPGTYSDGTLTVTFEFAPGSDSVINWSSNIGVDAVIVKGGPNANLYRYDPPAEVTSDEGLVTPDHPRPGQQPGLSHLNFCYDVDPTGSLTVIKKVVNDDDGQASSSAWTMNVAGPTPLSFSGADDPGTTNTVAPGSYTVSESNGPGGYTLTYSGDCDANGNVTVAANDTKTCILTNDDDDGPPPPENGTIIVEKQTNPDGYDPPQGGFVFSGDLDAVLNDGESASLEVEPGSYTVTENLETRPFWDLTSIVCTDSDSSGNLATLTATYVVAAGETVKCTFMNEKRGLIVVKKVTDPAGADESFAFTASYDQDGFSLSDGDENVSEPLSSGQYSVSEDTPEGWELESATCDNGDDPEDIDLPWDTVVTCTFVNRLLPEPGTIIVQKQTNPAGDETEFEFEFGDGTFDLADGEQEVLDDLEAGTYSVSENTPEGWDLTSATCSDQSPVDAISLQEGETVTCTFTNEKDANIVVRKVTSPAGSQQLFGFDPSWQDGGFPLADGQSHDSGDIGPGTYSVAEDVPEGWLLVSSECSDGSDPDEIGLEAGETVTCVFTNAQITVGRGSISVSKSANPTSVKEPGGAVGYSVTITNTSNVNVTIVNVVDDKFGDLDDSGGNGCFDVPINMAPGASSNCQFTGQVTGAAGTSHVNTVTASGVDAFGNALSASDDAKVDITPKLIDLLIVKDASSPTPLNGVVNYSLTVTNKGPDTATNVQLADPAPAGITYLTASPSQGTCNLTPALILCSLGTIAPGQSVTIAITGRATSVGSHTNIATVTGDGGRETNPADNVDSALTLVPAPLRPPTSTPKPTPKPQPKPAVCLTLTVTPKMIKADGRPDRVVAKVRAANKAKTGATVLVKGQGIRKSGRTNNKGVAVVTINPRTPGLITVTTIDAQKSCGPKRIGVVGVFLPPLTG